MPDFHPSAGIAFVCTSPSWGGLELNVLRLASWLTERGHPVTLYTGPGTPLFNEARKLGRPAVELQPHRKYFDFGAARSLHSRLRDSGIDTAMAFHRDDLDLMSWVKVFAGSRLTLIYQQHMQLGISRRDPVHTFRYARYDAWISPLEGLRDEVLSKTFVPAWKISVIPLGIETGRYSDPRPSRTEARNYFGLPDGGTTFGIIGRIDPGKGQQFLVETLREVRGRGHDARLLIVGSPTLEGRAAAPGKGHAAELERLIDSLEIGDSVFLRPFVDDNRYFFRAVDACVMATPAETYGMVTIEAMASGVPVIGTDAGGTGEILDGGRFGLLYRPGDREDFIAKSEVVLEGRYGNRMLEAARAHVAEKYSHEVECDKILSLITNLRSRRTAG